MAELHPALAVFLQNYQMTCGPACVMMARQFLKNTPIDPEDELSIWRKTKTNNGNYVYTTHPRLAMFLMSEGYRTELWHNYPSGYIYQSTMKRWDFIKRMKYYDRYRKEAESCGMLTKISSFTGEDIAKEVERGDTVAIVMTKIGSNTFFHHRLVYKVERNVVSVACPIEGLLTMDSSGLDDLMRLPYGRGALLVRR